jgi:hypothetical protein
LCGGDDGDWVVGETRGGCQEVGSVGGEGEEGYAADDYGDCAVAEGIGFWYGR